MLGNKNSGGMDQLVQLDFGHWCFSSGSLLIWQAKYSLMFPNRPLFFCKGPWTTTPLLCVSFYFNSFHGSRSLPLVSWVRLVFGKQRVRMRWRTSFDPLFLCFWVIIKIQHFESKAFISHFTANALFREIKIVDVHSTVEGYLYTL